MKCKKDIFYHKIGDNVYQCRFKKKSPSLIKWSNSKLAEKLINIKLEFVILHFFRMLTLSHESYSLSLKKHKKGIENF